MLSITKKFKPHIIIIASVAIILGIVTILGNIELLSSGSIYFAIGFTMIMIWTTLFIGYFVWATYFYNVNYGVSSKLWKRIEENKEKRAEGKHHDANAINDEPLFNPYQDQTFGFPPGTVRGMIAFTLLFGAIALLIVSFGMESELAAGSFFRDQYEFFKQAFLMMVAFYFGTRALKHLKGESSIEKLNTINSRGAKAAEGLVSDANNIRTNAESNTVAVTTNLPSAESAPVHSLVTIDSNDPAGDDPAKTQKGSIPPIQAVDPMA